MKYMYLNAATTPGSKRKVDLGISKTEWELMTDEAQNDIINEHLESVVDIWVTANEVE